MKNNLLLLFLFTALFFTSHPLWAQARSQQTTGGGTQGGGRYVIEHRYVQQLVWTGDEYTVKYEVVIERIEGRERRVYLREFTEKTTLEISLPPGNYRYRIIPYDYLEQSGEPSRWVTLEIKPPPVSVDGQIDNAQNAERQDETGGSIAGKHFNLYAGAAWSPVIPIHGNMGEVFNGFHAASALFRLGLLFDEWVWFNPGAELSASLYSLNNADGGNEITVQAGAAGLNFVAQKQLPHRMAVNARTGFALGFQAGEISAGQSTYSTGGMNAQFNFEASFLWFAWKQLYVEGGLGYTVFLNKDDNSGFLRPWLGAGWKF
ncbi:hypothetical protein [Treponema sp. R80B11-R83G3]